MRIAVTGATGFVGDAFLTAATAAGHAVTALTRRTQPERELVRWVIGSLETPRALKRLVTAADVVVHIAGVVNAPDRDGFVAGNIAGTEAIVAACEAAHVHRFVHVSSLAAREPALSTYGWSKAEAERVVKRSALDWTIVRPTGVYGPGDTELRDMFRMAKRGLVFLPPRGRVSLVHVDDLAHLLLALAEQGGADRLYEVDDGSAGYEYAELARMIGTAVGRPRVRSVHMPAALMRLAAWIDVRMRGTRAKLTPDRVGYLCHPDWTANTAMRPPRGLWHPQVPTPAGLADTAAWYRAAGLL